MGREENQDRSHVVGFPRQRRICTRPFRGRNGRSTHQFGTCDRRGGREDRRAVRRVNPAIPVILDTKGPEIRVTAVADEYGGAIGFQAGECVKVRGTANGEPSTRDTIYFNVATVVRDIAVGARLLIADGELELRVTDKTDEELTCEFVRGGTLRSRKSVNVPGMKIDLPSVTEKDRRFIEWAVKNDVDFIAHSFVRSAGDVRAVQEILDRYDSPIKIISKIENQQGIDNLDEIVEASYGVMVARGDLGSNFRPRRFPTRSDVSWSVA